MAEVRPTKKQPCILEPGDPYIVHWRLSNGTICGQTIEDAEDLNAAILRAAVIADVHYSKVTVLGEDDHVRRL